MPTKIKKINLIIVLLVLNFSISAQDAVLSQPHYSVYFTNPAFAGTYTDGGRVSSFYRQQWILLEHPFSQYGVSYDQSVSQYNSGFGVHMQNLVSGAINMPSAHLSFAYKFKISPTTILSLGVEGGIAEKYLKTASLLFPDDIDDNNIPSQEIISSGHNKIYSDFAIGALFLHNKFHFGLSGHHLNRPYSAKSEGNYSRIDIKVSGQLSYVVEIQKRTRGKHHYLIPYLIANYQGLQTNFMYGSSMEYNNLLTGVFVRHSLYNIDALILSVGFEKNQFRAVYSYDINIGKRHTHMLGAHEITMAYMFYIKQKKKRKAISCPHFIK